MKAVGSTHESGACSVGLLHAGCSCAHEVEPRADERIAMDTALRDPESRRSLYDEDSAVLPDAEKKAQSVLDSAEESLSSARERCDTAWTTDAVISAKLYCVIEEAASDFNRRHHVPTVVSTEVDESEQVHRDVTKDHNCVVAAVVQQAEEVSKDDTVDVVKSASFHSCRLRRPVCRWKKSTQEVPQVEEIGLWDQSTKTRLTTHRCCAPDNPTDPVVEVSK